MNASLSSSVEPGPPTPVAKPSRGGGRGLLAVLFMVYLVLLAWVVLWKLEVPYVGGGALRQIKLVPFARTAEAGASAPLEVVANVMLFVPFGLYLGLLAPSWPWWKYRRPRIRAGARAGSGPAPRRHGHPNPALVIREPLTVSFRAARSRRRLVIQSPRLQDPERWRERD